MPVFEIQSPDGRSYEVDAPSQAEALAGFQRAQASGAAPTPSHKPEFGPLSQLIVGNQQKGPQGNLLDPFAQGIWSGWSDEVAGLAGGMWSAVTGRDPVARYNEVTDRYRQRLANVRERNPVGATLAEIGGAMAPAILSRGETIPGQATRMGIGQMARAGALEGAGYGLAYGSGTAEGGPANRALGAATGALGGLFTGGLAGAASQPIGRAAGALWQHAGNPLWNRVSAPFRGVFNPDAEASRRILDTMAIDNAASSARRLQPGDEALAATHGQPLLNVDRGGEATRDLARTAANISPRGREALEEPLDARFEGQGVRVVEAVRRLVGGQNVATNREMLESMAAAANRPAYRRAMNAPGAASMWDAELEQLAGAPVVRDAMRMAAVTGRNRAAMEGVPPIANPFYTDPATGALRMRDGIRPNLRFWDETKKQLDAIGTREARQAARVLREHLDGIVPAYRDARAGAARFFGAEDALSAGEAFVGSRMGNDEARRVLARMSRPERQLFAEGYADGLVRRILESGDNRNIIVNQIFASPAGRERIAMALGPNRARELEAILRIESVMNMARRAMGNSTTARQLAAMGIATGGTGLYGLGTGDWRPIAGVLTAIGTKRLNSAITERVMRRIAEQLASPDPAVFQRGVATLSRNGNLMVALRRAMATAGAQQSTAAMPAGAP